MVKEWIAVDLDGTLAEYYEYIGPTYIGTPIFVMVERVKRWLKQGKVVKIFTARADEIQPDYELNIDTIKRWCRMHIGQELEITNKKDRFMTELWDDRAVQIITNTGARVDGRV